MQTTGTTKTIYLVDDPSHTLMFADLTIRHCDAYQQAEAREDWDEIDRLDRENDALVEAYGLAWLEAAERAGEFFGVEVDAIVTPDVAEQREQDARNGELIDDRDPYDGRDLVSQVSQYAHELVGVEIDPDGTWRVWL
jgi:hypothetical protein